MKEPTTSGASLLENGAGLLTPRLTTPEQDKGERETGVSVTPSTMSLPVRSRSTDQIFAYVLKLPRLYIVILLYLMCLSIL